MELHQSDLYLSYISRLKWRHTRIDTVAIIYRPIPIFGGIAKIQRSNKLPNAEGLIALMKSSKIKTLALEPTHSFRTFGELSDFVHKLTSHGIRINESPYLPTKTILIDLTGNEKIIFSRMTEAKQRAIRKATKLNVRIEISQNIDALIGIKNAAAGLFGSITTYGAKELFLMLTPDHTDVLLAFDDTLQLVGGIFLLYWNTTAYYWIAGATKHGKKLYAPTLLVWEALRRAKQKGATLFDFVGVWDERLPKASTSWKGFTKFKEGFGGYPFYYPIVLSNNILSPPAPNKS